MLTLPLTIDDDDFIGLTQDTVVPRLGLQVKKGQKERIGVIADLIARIRERNLFVRAYAFSHTMPHDPFRNDPTQKAGLERLARDIKSNPEQRKTLIQSIAENGEQIAELARDQVSVHCDAASLSPTAVVIQMEAWPSACGSDWSVRGAGVAASTPTQAALARPA